MKLKNFGMAWFVSNDLEKTKKLFTEVLGLKLTTDDPRFGWLEFSAGEGQTKIGVGKYNEEYGSIKPGQNAIITLTVDDLQSAREELTQKGVKLVGDIIEVPEEVLLQTFTDADNNFFQLVQIIRKK